MRLAIRLTKHKSGQTSLDLESLEKFKIRGESKEVVITKVVPNYTFFLHEYCGNFITLWLVSRIGNHFEFIFSFWKFCHTGPTHHWSGCRRRATCQAASPTWHATHRPVGCHAPLNTSPFRPGQSKATATPP
jgi:hypothetical protein